MVVLLNRSGGAVAADPEIAAKIGNAFKAQGIEAEIEVISGGDCAVRCRAISERGDPLLVVGGGDGTIGAAASALVGSKTLLGILSMRDLYEVPGRAWMDALVRRRIEAILEKHSFRAFGFLGDELINVLEVNLAMDGEFGGK